MNDCFCNVLSWPTACARVCSGAADRTLVARWYWDVCPSAMDSRLGQFGLTRYQFSLASTVDAWAVQSPTSNAIRTGFDCYYSGSCGILPTLTSSTPSSTRTASTSNSGGSTHLSQTTIIVLIVGIVAVVIVAIIAMVYWRRKRRPDSEIFIMDLLLHLLDRNQEQLTANVLALERAVERLDNRANRTDENQRNLVARAERLLDRLGASQSNTQNSDVSDHLEASLGEALECPICLSVLHNPVSVVTRETSSGAHGCRKSLIIPLECIYESNKYMPEFSSHILR